MKYEIIQKRAGELPTYRSSSRSFNELEMLAEELECVKIWLNDIYAPTHDDSGNKHSVVGRIKLLLGNHVKYPFAFKEINLTPDMLKLLGFSEWHDGSGDFVESRIHLDGSSFSIYDIEEKDDDADGYGLHPKQYLAQHYCDGNWNTIYFLHELYEYIKSSNNETALAMFLDRCKKCNLMPYIESYLQFRDGNSN